jgi:hypothetical protein
MTIKDILCFGNIVTQYSFINVYTALCWALVFSSVLQPFYADGRTSWTGDQFVARPLPTNRITQTQNNHTHTHPCLNGIRTHEHKFERAKTVHALDRKATVIGSCVILRTQN